MTHAGQSRRQAPWLRGRSSRDRPRGLVPHRWPPSSSASAPTGLLVRRNVLVMFMCVELMLNAVNLTFVTFARMLNDIGGQVVGLLRPGGGGRRSRGRARDHRGHLPPPGRGHRRRPPHPEGLTTPLNAAYVILALAAGSAPSSCSSAGRRARRAPCRVAGHAHGRRLVRGHRDRLGRPARPHRRPTARVDKNIFTWIPVGGLHVNFALQLDPLSITMAPVRHRRRQPDPPVLDRLHAGRPELPPVLLPAQPVPLLHGRAGPGRQLPLQLPRLGGRRLLLLRAGRLLVRAGDRRRWRPRRPSSPTGSATSAS